MKFRKLLCALAIILCTVCAILFTVSADNTDADIFYVANDSNAGTQINIQTTDDGKTYLFLPSSADLSQLKLEADSKYTKITITGDSSVTVHQDETFDLTALFENPEALNNEYNVTITLAPQAGKTITTKYYYKANNSLKNFTIFFHYFLLIYINIYILICYYIYYYPLTNIF